LKHDAAQLTSVGQLFVGHAPVQFTVQLLVCTGPQKNTKEVSQVTNLVSPVPPFTFEALKFDTVLFVNESFAPKFLFFMILLFNIVYFELFSAVKVSAIIGPLFETEISTSFLHKKAKEMPIYK
jgi:hypothetical protein